MTRRPGVASDLAVAAALFLASFGYYYAFRRLGWFIEDEGVLYYQYLRVYEGQLPYRDFFTGYPPLIYYVHSALFALFGTSINATRIAMAVVNATTALGLYLVTRRIAGRGWALIPPALFVVMHPADAAIIVFHNSPYPSWYAVTFGVLGTWTLLRAIAAETWRRRTLWLFATGVGGGLTFLSKQNAGIFFLWGASGFLASYPAMLPVAARDTSRGGAAPPQEPRLLRVLRVGYLMLPALATLSLVKAYLSLATVCVFVVPMAGLAVIGAARRFDAPAFRRLLFDGVILTAGAGLMIVPWVVYFGVQMGFGRFLHGLFFVGTDVDRNLYIPFPAPMISTLILMAPIAVWAILVGLRVERRVERRILAAAVGLDLAALAAVLVWQADAVGALLRFRYNLWQMYTGSSMAVDNFVIYSAVLVLVVGLAIAWRQARSAAANDTPPPAAFLAVLWIGACTFLVYYPRMDVAHLVSAVPLLYAVGCALLALVAARLGAVGRRGTTSVARPLYAVICALLALFIVGLKTGPRVYSRFRLVHSPEGTHFAATPQVEVHNTRAELYLPIYLERNRLYEASFGELVRYLQETVPAGEPIFAFPALPMVYFISGHENPTREDYFFGDNVGFRAQLDVLRELEQAHVRAVVTSNDPTNYFMVKDRDFTHVITAYLLRNYYVARRIGPYDVLWRYGAGSQDRDDGNTQ